MRRQDSGWLGGVLLPVVTPFDPVTGEIAPVSFRENLRGWLEAPIDGIVLFGTNGEGALLEDEEKLRLVGFARDLVPPLMPLVAGAGKESTRGTIAEAKRLAEAGVDALLVRPPAYFGAYLTPAALRDHFLAVADASPAPIIIYNAPRFTGTSLEPGLVRELARHENVVGLKDSSGNLKRLAAYAEACEGRCRLLVGNGALLYAALELGASGGIIGLGMLAPHGCAQIVREYREGNTRRAGELQERLAPVHRVVIGEYSVPGLKAALDLLGYNGGPPRPPLRPLGAKERARVARVLQEAGLLEEGVA
ncbi:MAG TPA: dihydrodipicolinate synthase family protein [Longimicrobiales bacterium]|jgi:4-hydroxy-2-oxoglutarate aldolase